MKKYTLTAIMCVAAACARTNDYETARSLQQEVGFDVPVGPEQEPEGIADDGAFEADTPEGLRLTSVQKSTSVSLQVSQLVRPTEALPTVRLERAAFEAPSVASAFGKTTEPFTAVSGSDNSEVFESSSFRLLRASRHGLLLLTRKASILGSFVGSQAALSTAARASLQQWGVSDGEVGTVLSRRVLSHDTGEAAPRVHRYKTFIQRSIGGVPVIGHRAVISYGRDGSFARALLVWPPLASTGHKLSSKLTDAQIGERATAALIAHGVASGTARMRYKYAATLNEKGEASLRLLVGVRVKGTSTAEAGSESHEVDVEVDAE